MMVRKNRFTKALKHIKSTELDEKIAVLEAAPTNNTAGVYSRGPGGQRLGPKDPARTFYPDQDGNWPSGIPGTAGDPSYTRPEGYWDGGPGSVDTVEYANLYTTDWSHPDESNYQDTSGLIAEDGTVKSLLPAGSRSFILGPLVDGYVRNHTHDDFTRIGYIQKDTRQFVLLATIPGHWNTTDIVYAGEYVANRVWDGTETGFTSYNENFTLAMAQWFRDRMLNGKDLARNVSYYASGGIGQGPCSDPDAPPGSLGGNGPGGDGHGGSGGGAGGGDPDIGEPQGPPENGPGNPEDNHAAEQERRRNNQSQSNDPNVDKAIGHGLSADRAAEMDPAELAKFVQLQDNLQSDIDKYGAEEKAARKEMRDIAIGFGVDVALTIFGGAILKGGFKALSLASKAIKGKNVVKAADVAVKANRARQQAQLNNLTKFGKTLKGSKKAEYIDDLADLQHFTKNQPNQSAVNKLYNKLNNPKNYGGKGGLLNAVDDVGSGTISQTGSKPFMHKTTGVKSIKTPKQVRNPKTGKMEYDLNLTNTKGEVVAKRFKSPDGKWYQVPNPSVKGGSNPLKGYSKNPIKNLGDRLKWEVMENSVPDSSWNNWLQTGEPYKGWSLKSFTRNVAGGSGSGPTSGAAAALKTVGGAAGAGLAGKAIHDKLNQGNQGNQSSINIPGKGVERVHKELGPLANAGKEANSILDKMEKGMENDMPPEEFEKLFKQWKQKIKQKNRNRPDGIPVDPEFIKQILSGGGKGDVNIAKGGGKLSKGSLISKGGAKLSKGSNLSKGGGKLSKTKGYKKYVTSSYNPEGITLSESARRQLREVRKSYELREAPVQKLKKYRPNFKGKFSPQNTPNVTASKQTDDGVKAKNSQGQAWSIGDKYWSGYETTERMNVIYDRLGHGSMAWDRIIDEARQKNGWKNREIQEQLNIIAAEKAERQMCSDYESPWGTVIHEQGASTKQELDTVMKDPLVKKVAKRLKQEIDYPDKPARQGYPDKPPAKQIDGWHPEYGKKYKYDKLDPESAKSMPPTGNPEIDANVEKARKQPKVKEEYAVDWRSAKSFFNLVPNKKKVLDEFHIKRNQLHERIDKRLTFRYNK